MKLGFYGMGASGKAIFSYIVQYTMDTLDKDYDGYILIDDVIEEKEFMGYPIYKFEEIKKRFSTDELEIITMNGEPGQRKLMCDKIKSAGFGLGRYIDPAAQIDNTAKIGAGAVIIWNSRILYGCEIGENCLIINSMFMHHIKVEAHCFINNDNTINGYCQIGEQTYMGSNCAISDSVTIGKKCTIALGSAVFKDVPDENVAIGNPAKPRKRDLEKGLFGK